jgi:hypothetical protein
MINGGLYRLLSLKNDFPDEFNKMRSDAAPRLASKELKAGKNYFPFFTNNYHVVFRNCQFYKRYGSAISFSINPTNSESEIIDDSWVRKISYDQANIKTIEDVYLLINYSLA